MTGESSPFVYEDMHSVTVSVIRRFRDSVPGFEREDFIQESHVAFLDCLRRYGGLADMTIRRFRGLYKRVLTTCLARAAGPAIVNDRFNCRSVRAAPDEDGEPISDPLDMLEDRSTFLSPERAAAIAELPFDIQLAIMVEFDESPPPRARGERLRPRPRPRMREMVESKLGFDAYTPIKEALE